MFTGLIEEIGEIQRIEAFDGGIAYWISAHQVFEDLKIDDSIAVNGCCQTVVAIDRQTFKVQSIQETLEKTTFKHFQLGDSVNLERAMLPTQRMGGHFVQGHINGTAQVCSSEHRGENKYVGIELPEALFHYCILEGSIAIDGVSLTLAQCEPATRRIYVSIIPHTWKVTTFKHYIPGRYVNIEVDMLAKMVHQFTRAYRAPESNKTP